MATDEEISKIALELVNKHFSDKSITTEEIFEIGIKKGIQMERERIIAKIKEKMPKYEYGSIFDEDTLKKLEELLEEYDKEQSQNKTENVSNWCPPQKDSHGNLLDKYGGSTIDYSK